MSNIHGQNLEKPLSFNGNSVKQGDITIPRRPYWLEKHEFDLLNSNKSDIKDWKKRFLQIAIGVSITIVSKIIFIVIELLKIKSIEDKNKIDFSLKPWEFLSLAITWGLFAIWCIRVERDKKDKKYKLIQKLEDHFNY